MPGKRSKKLQKQRKPEDDLELHELDEALFNVAAERDEEDAAILHDKRPMRHADDEKIGLKELYKTEDRGVDAGLGDIDKEEEEIAREEQLRRNAQLSADDFGVDGLSEVVPAAKPKKKAKQQADMDALGKFLDSAEQSLAGEAVATDYHALSADEKRRILQREAPELAAMIEDFKAKLAEVRDVLSPVLEKVNSGELQTSKGVGFLEMKLHLFITYLMHLSFYLLLKVEGRPIKGNPVVEKLVEIRAYIDKLKPIERKLQHQISRLLSRAAVQASGGEVAAAEKANVSALAEAADAAEDGLYSAPKLGASRLSAEEKKQREERLLKLAGKAKSEQEEAQFGRLTTTRKQEKLLKHAKQNFSLEGEGEEAAGLDPMLTGTMVDPGMSLMAQIKKKKEQRLRAQVDAEDGDEDDEEEGDEGEVSFDEEDAEDGSDDEEEMEGEEGGEEAEARAFLEEEKARVEQAKRAKKRRLNEQRQHSGKKEEDLGQTAGDVVDGHRKISHQISKNKGLVAERKKKFKNPRVRSRHRAKKQLNKVQLLVRPVKSQAKKDKGEARIRTNIIRSVPIS